MTNFMFTVIVVIVLAVIILFGTVFGKQLRVKMKGRTDEVMMQSCIEEDPPYFQAGLLCKSSRSGTCCSYTRRNAQK